MKTKKFIALILSAIFITGGAGCSYMNVSNEYPVQIAGYTFNQQPDSIVCLDDSVADILIACGYSNLITARSNECTQEELADIQSVGTENAPDTKKIIAVHPDVVFADKNLSDDARSQLSKENINIITMVQARDNKDLSVLYESVAAVAGGDKSGRQMGIEKAESVIMTMSDLQRIVPESELLMTACYLYDTNGHVAFNDSFSGKLFSYANAANVCGNDDADVIQKITLSNPQYIFCDTGVKEQLQSDDNFKNLNAVKNGNVYEIDHHVWERQGNSITQVLSFMIETMYPELVEESSEPSVEESSQEDSSEPSVEESSQEESSEPSAEESSQEESSEPSAEESSQEESSQPSAEESSQEESSEPSAEESSQEESSQAQPSKVEADDSLKITAGMRYSVGESDDNVAIIQKRLKDLGYFKDDPTGYYGPLTAQAVSEYETTNRIAPDGNLSTPELYLLFSDEVLPANS